MVPSIIVDSRAGEGLPIAFCASSFFVAIVAGIECVVSGLSRGRLWAWIAGLCIFGLHVPSLFLPLGVLGLWGLLDGGSRAECGVGQRASCP